MSVYCYDIERNDGEDPENVNVNPRKVVSCFGGSILFIFVEMLPAEVWAAIRVFRKYDLIGGIGEVAVLKVICVTVRNLAAESFRLQSC